MIYTFWFIIRELTTQHEGERRLAQTLIIYRTSSRGRGGYFVSGESDDLGELGGTLDIAEARAFASKKAAAKVIEALARQARVNASDFYILKRA